MEIHSEYNNGHLSITLIGELDHHAAGEAMKYITDKLDTYLPRSCELDFGDLVFMDSSGIALVIRAYRRVSELEGRLSVINVRKQPEKVLDAAGVGRMVEIVKSPRI